MPEDTSGWGETIYACEDCGSHYTTYVYASTAVDVLGAGNRLGSADEMIPTLATTCATDGGRFRRVPS